MSQQLINRSGDLKRLWDDGYEIEVRSSFLFVHSIPYVNAKGNMARGTLVSSLTLAGEITATPGSHVAYFIGGHPCHSDGTVLTQIQHSSMPSTLAPGITIDHMFSSKPPNGYVDYYEKMSRYADIISSEAVAIDPNASPRTFKLYRAVRGNSPFAYRDTASSRAGIAAITNRLAVSKVSIVGLGGTGSYILDLISKTPVKEIHLYDGDHFLQHNAFRSPGAASLEDLLQRASKVDYFKQVYSKIHNGIIAHEQFVSQSDLTELQTSSFVFICIDHGGSKRLMVDHLQEYGIPFIDVGIGIQIVEGTEELVGVCRSTTSTVTKSDHIDRRVLFADDAENVYSPNIQIADLNALNAAFAVIKWKKLMGFYQDLEHEHDSTYSLNVNQLTSDEIA